MPAFTRLRTLTRYFVQSSSCLNASSFRTGPSMYCRVVKGKGKADLAPGGVLISLSVVVEPVGG